MVREVRSDINLVDADAEFLGRGGQGHKGVPGFGAVQRVRAKAHIAFAYALANTLALTLKRPVVVNLRVVPSQVESSE